jgi:carboxyl-terminal processing protease
MKRAKYIFAAGLLTISLFFVLEKSIGRAVSSRTAEPTRSVALLETIISLIRNDYLEEKDPVQTMNGSFQGLVNSLDSTSSYLNKESTSRYLGQKEAPIEEPGLVLHKGYGSFARVVGIIENSPAEKSGFLVGDYITEINGLSTPLMSLTEVNLYLRDTAETPLDLKVLREDKTLQIKVERAFLFPEPVEYSAQAGTAGILKIVRLSPPVVSKIKVDLAPGLRRQKKPLIIDLRNCQEGTFEEAQELLNLFLKADSIGYLQKRGETKELLPALQEPLLAQIPLVVWISQATIGPAEAVAAVLQDFKRARIVGLPTAGLAADHQFFLLRDGTSVILTSGIFCLNSGDKLWGRGTEPDVKLEMEGQSFDAFLKKTKILLSNP